MAVTQVRSNAKTEWPSQMVPTKSQEPQMNLSQRGRPQVGPVRKRKRPPAPRYVAAPDQFLFRQHFRRRLTYRYGATSERVRSARFASMPTDEIIFF